MKRILWENVDPDFWPRAGKTEFERQKIGGIADPVNKKGEHAWYFQVLPKIPMRLIFYEADEDFPVDIVLLADQSATLFLPFECLAFLAGCLVGELIAASESSD